MQKLFLFVFFALIAIINATTPRSEAEIKSLPGLNYSPNFKQYSGYITVDENSGRNLFYWFVESQNDPANDPVVLWLQGGPGCSSIGAGFLQENGPFLPNYTGDVNGKPQVELRPNYYAWNRVANVIYLDSPAGVGYSYQTNPPVVVTNDNRTAHDSTIFLEKFFQQIYPDFASNEFWITGESYAGVYIPTLAYNILTNSTDKTLVSNLKKGGLMLGNPVTGCEGEKFQGDGSILDMNTQFQLFYWHAMISPRLFGKWGKNKCDTADPPSLSTCELLYLEASNSIGRLHQPLKDLQFFNNKNKNNSPLARHPNNKNLHPKSQKVAAGEINPDCLYYSFCVGNSTLRFTELSNEDCFSVDDQISQWLNDEQVQTALHVHNVPRHWQACGGVLYDRNVGSLIPYLEDIFQLAPTSRVLYYAGDIDIATVPFASTFRCLETMNRPIKQSWRYYQVNKEIAGYVEIYDTYTLATLKAAGHEAPAYQPASAYHMFTHFLNNEPF